MSIKRVLDAIFGASQDSRKVASRTPADEEFPLAVVDEVHQVRAQVQQAFSAEREADVIAQEAKAMEARLERARTYLRKAGAEQIFANLLRETRYWPSWFEKGALDDLSNYGVGVVSVEPKRQEGSISQSSYTVDVGSRRYRVEIEEKGRHYLPDRLGNRYGEVRVVMADTVLFACGIEEDDDDIDPRWRLSLYSLKVLTSVEWLPDIAGLSEIAIQRSRSRMESSRAKHVAEQAAGVMEVPPLK